MIKTYAEFMDAIERNYKRFSLVPTDLLNDAGVEIYHLYRRLSWDIAFSDNPKEMLEIIDSDDSHTLYATRRARSELRMIRRCLQKMMTKEN